MKIIDTILTSTIIGLCMLIGSYYVGKRLLNRGFEEKFEEILDYFRTTEGQQSVYTLGLVFGKGIQQGIGLKGKLRGGKIFGIPIELVQPFIDKIMGGKTEEAISKESENIPSGKFG